MGAIGGRLAGGMVVGTTRGKPWNAAKQLQGFSVAWESGEDPRRVSGTLSEDDWGVKRRGRKWGRESGWTEWLSGAGGITRP